MANLRRWGRGRFGSPAFCRLWLESHDVGQKVQSVDGTCNRSGAFLVSLWIILMDHSNGSCVLPERYQPLPHLVHKSHFLFDIQLPLLEAYLSRITGSLDAYERLSSSFVRAVPGALAGQVGHGVDTKRLTSGVEGLTRVVKALVSARWIKAAMEAWGEDLVCHSSQG